MVPPCVRRIPERAATVHVVMHSQLRWRARAHGADERTRLRRLLEEFSLIVVKIYSIRMASAEKVK